MNADRAAELVTRKRREYGLPPIHLNQAQKVSSYNSLLIQAAAKGVSIETAIEATVRMQKQTELLGRPL